MKRTIIIVFYFQICLFCYSQSTWLSVGDRFNGRVRCFYADSVTNLLYAGGFINHIGPVAIHEIAVWNGVQWDSLGGGSLSNTPVWGIGKFGNDIYASGFFYHNNQNFIGRWDGIQWDTNLTLNINGPVVSYIDEGNKLLMAGRFDSVNSQSCTSIIEFDGTNFTCFPFSFSSGSNSVNAAILFQNKLFLAGSFFANNIQDLAQWNGSTLSQVGTGIHGGFSSINSLVIYKNELYIGGNFSTADGNPGNNILKWDGVSLTNVGIGTDGTIFKMAVFHDDLYVVGGFDHAGGFPCSKISKWDGTDWSQVSTDVFNNGIETITVSNDELFVGGAFTKIGNDTIVSIAKYNNLVSVNYTKKTPLVNVYPNPVKDYLKIQDGNNGIDEIKITDILGKEIYSKDNSEFQNQIDIAFLKSGIYFLILDTKEGRVVKKFVKE